MSHTRRLPVFFLLLFLLPAVAQSQAAGAVSALATDGFDTEHIFGFAEGSDIGPEGVWEIESFTVGSFGAVAGNFNVGNDTSARYTLTDELRLSAGTLTDYFSINNVPGLRDRSAAEFSGITTEARWNILNRQTSPFGMSLSIDPEWHRTDPASARRNDNYSVTTALLIDKELVPETFFAALNLIHSASFLPLNDSWEHDDSFSLIVSGAYAITPDIVVGAEIIHENLAQNGCLNAHALFVGPELFLRLDKSLTASAAWAVRFPTSRLGSSISRSSNVISWSFGWPTISNRWLRKTGPRVDLRTNIMIAYPPSPARKDTNDGFLFGSFVGQRTEGRRRRGVRAPVF